MRTGGKCLLNVHAKSRLIPEALRALRAQAKGQAASCPDRARAIPCTVRAITGRRAAGRGYSRCGPPHSIVLTSPDSVGEIGEFYRNALATGG